MLINHLYNIQGLKTLDGTYVFILLNLFLRLSSGDRTTRLTYARHKEAYSQGQLADHVNFSLKCEINVYPNYSFLTSQNQ